MEIENTMKSPCHCFSKSEFHLFTLKNSVYLSLFSAVSAVLVRGEQW